MNSPIKRNSEADSSRIADNPIEAFRDVVYTAGVKLVADHLGYKVGTLYNKCDADIDSHHQPTLRDMLLVTSFTGDHRVLDSADRMFSRAAFPIAQGLSTSDEDLLRLLCRIGSEKGHMVRALSAGLSDGRMDAKDKAIFRREAFDVLQAVATLMERVENME